MNEKIICSTNIQKLGHEIQEIRERALLNITSKLNHGFTFENDLAQTKEILTKLFDWFLFEPCSKEEIILNLVKRILKSKSGCTLIEHFGKDSFRKEIKRIHSYIEPKFYKQLSDIETIIEEYQPKIIVPPLESNLPLSYRTGQSHFEYDTQSIGTTAMAFEGFVQQDESARQEAGCVTFKENCVNNKPNYLLNTLKWQVLIEPDRHVLQTIERSLKGASDPSALLHSAEFFSNVLLHDFPAEVFLQRSNIVLEFHELLNNCTSSRITNSVLNALHDLTKALRVRVHQHTDPCMYSSKEVVVTNSQCSTPDSSSRKNASGQSSDEFDKPEKLLHLKSHQIYFPDYCLVTFKYVLKYLSHKSESMRQSRHIVNQKNVNIALSLLEELLGLTVLVIKKEIWNERSDQRVHKVLKQISEVLDCYGTVVDYFRLESTSNDSDLECRACYLYILHNCVNFMQNIIPLSQTGIILPRSLKEALSNSLVDVLLSKLYPDTHKTLLEHVQSFSVSPESNSLTKFYETNKLCDSMNSAVYFMKNYHNLKASEAIILARKALPCFQFHQNKYYVKLVVELCATKLPLYVLNEGLLENFEYVILKLLGHPLDEIREETYRLCQKRVISAIGPKLNLSGTGAPGDQVMFLLRSKILIKIASHGLSSHNLQIQKFSEDILIHIIKCKILVSDYMWNKVVEAVISALPILLCYVDKMSLLGKSLFEILDPENSEAALIPRIEVVKGNIQILFGFDISMREEAFSRLCWLLSSQFNSRDMIPRLHNLNDRALPHVCQIQRILDVNKLKNSHHFYQPSSLHQVLDLLKSANVEPLIRRSALTQISVMMEDKTLHQIFLDNNGLNLVLGVLNSSLTEKDFGDYPDSVIPVISILKNICLFSSSARRDLCDDVDLYYNVLRGLFMYFTEERLKQDAICLLFLLIFNGFIVGSPSMGDFSVLHLISQKINVPFTCGTHGKTDEDSDESSFALLTADRWCLSSIQLHWNSENFGGYNELLSWDKISYEHHHINDILKLRSYDLMCLKSSSIDHCVQKYLFEIQNGTSHESVIRSINKLTIYVQLYIICKINKLDDETFLGHPWENTFSRFFKSLPSTPEDSELLSVILRFLKLLAPLYKHDGNPWLNKTLKSTSNCLLDLITAEPSTKEENKTVCQDLLSLISTSVSEEQHFMDYYNDTDVQFKRNTSWNAIIQIISNNLKFSNTTHFYNLSYLDSLLACLVHLTASLGWSNSKPNSVCKSLISQMIPALCELVIVFHSGKGKTAAVSVMGLSITKHVVLILNHILAEIHFFKIKEWEANFINLDEEEWLKSFLVLWTSRDVILQAASIQFFAGLALSARLAIHIVNELKHEQQGIWKMALILLIDTDEANIVKEHCALLLANLVGHTEPLTSKKCNSTPNLIPAVGQNGSNKGSSILVLFDEYRLYEHAVTILSCLYTNQMINLDYKFNNDDVERYSTTASSSGNSTDNSDSNLIATPSFVKALVMLLRNSLNLNFIEVSSKLHDSGVVKLLLRCICNPTMDVGDTKKLSLYCEILEMDATICLFLAIIAKSNIICLGTIIHTKDCLNTIVSLLNPKSYDTQFPQLLYLRNQLWSTVFRLLSVLLGSDSNGQQHNKQIEVLGIITKTINDIGNTPFLESVHEAIKGVDLQGLQTTALVTLSVLAGADSQRIFGSNTALYSVGSSVQTLLDTCRQNPDLEQLDSDNNVNLREQEVFGAKICKLLLNLYSFHCTNSSRQATKNKQLIYSVLSNILCISQEAKKTAVKHGFLETVIKQLRDFQMKLSLESVDILKKVADKKRICPVLVELNELAGLITNFMVSDEHVKNKLSELGLSDLVHKLWVWFLTQRLYLVNVLKMLCTFTTNTLACQSLPLTSSVSGTGPRKVPSTCSLLHTIISLIEKEMDLVSKTHNLSVLELCFCILNNSCSVLECRIVLCKSSILNSISRLYPVANRRHQSWESVELICLEFLQVFALHPEGQSHIAKHHDLFELLIVLCDAKSTSRIMALLVLRNLAFYQSNRSRLLNSGGFLSTLRVVLESGSKEERDIVVLIMWSLAANNQKAKVVFKSAQLDSLLEQNLKRSSISDSIHAGDVQRMSYVLAIISDRVK